MVIFLFWTATLLQQQQISFLCQLSENYRQYLVFVYSHNVRCPVSSVLWPKIILNHCIKYKLCSPENIYLFVCLSPSQLHMFKVLPEFSGQQFLYAHFLSSCSCLKSPTANFSLQILNGKFQKIDKFQVSQYILTVILFHDCFYYIFTVPNL